MFGQGRAVPLDGNAKARIWAYANAYTERHRKPKQGRGPLTRAFLDVLRALLWAFHNQHTGRCFPSYERIAEAAKVHRSTVAEAIHAFELAGVMTWENRLIRQRVNVPGLFGPTTIVVPRRTSNAYRFHDPKPVPPPVLPKSESPTGTEIKSFQSTASTARGIPNDPTALARVDAALARWGEAIKRREQESLGT